MSTEPAVATDGEAVSAIEDITSQMIAEHGGMRAALVAAVSQNEDLRRRLDMTMAAVSYGFSRGWHHKQE